MIKRHSGVASQSECYGQLTTRQGGVSRTAPPPARNPQFDSTPAPGAALAVVVGTRRARFTSGLGRCPNGGRLAPPASVTRSPRISSATGAVSHVGPGDGGSEERAASKVAGGPPVWS